MIRDILAALADLAPARSERVLDVSAGGRPLVWLAEPHRVPHEVRLDRLAALDALHRDDRVLRCGLAFVVGGVDDDGVRRRVRLPLLAQPVRLERVLRGYRVVPAGDLELTGLVEDRALAASFEAAPGLAGEGWLTAPGTTAWITTVAEAAGLPVSEVVPKVPRRIGDDGLVAVAAAGLFLARDVVGGGLRGTLLAWANRPGLADTALTRVYADPAAGTDTDTAASTAASTTAGTDPGTAGETAKVLSPLPLNADQRAVVRRARAEPVAVLSGPPGSGKSHALVAAALDVVDRGGCVLVATQSVHAADVLADLLRRHRGPTPVLFGDAERRQAVADELSRGVAAGTNDLGLAEASAAVAAASAEADALRAGITARLETERLAATLPRWEPLLAELSADAPGAFAPGTDLAAAARAAVRADAPGNIWWRRLRRAVAQRRLRRLAGAAAGVPLDRLRAALAAGEAVRAAAALAVSGTDLAASWSALTGAEAALADAVGAAMRARATSARRWSGRARRSAGALGAALSAGRNRRRELLAGLDGPALVRALPLWIGTAVDVDDLLPPIAGLFDLVILDEASHIDQLRAAPVLARARRALVAGDPRQLRFVSFVADVDVDATLSRHGLARLADRLDVRRSSAFDVAAGAAPVTWLSEHFRSAPHLIEFSARRFYGGRLELVTRHPRTEATDVIDVVRVPAAALSDGVNRAEVEAVVTLIRKLADQPPAGGIGVLTPFRAQAEALEAALLAAFPVEEIERLGLRCGTVHRFQGSEADVIIASLGLLDGDAPGRQRFVTDPKLFNVMVTRARHRMTVVTSLASPEGTVADYLRYAERPPVPAPADPPADGWVAALAEGLGRAGLEVRPDYPVGRWRVDLCVGAGPAAAGLICGVHPDGVAAHLERQTTLLRAGWRLHDAFASRWAGNSARAVLDLAHRLGSPG
jgi:hypothetical protein